ncbi:hypothetical protein OESDEN_08710 [Oesophagostomum dentatum]|uniref:Carboxylesterase type B domain-containing protein n=1 Tax=Oesophagostomum dentatum TaxID=61180 RepID=A0A0B1T1J1_OESDE|nr:hypothetical protein OESDEN_08710 [Oesophagostomum dentatum]
MACPAKADEAFGDVLPMTFPFVPVSADPNFFKGDVFKRLRKGNFKKDFSAILGTVEDEGTYWLPYYVADHGFSFDPSISPEDPKNAALIDESQYQQSMKLFLPYFGDSSKIGEALTKEYRTVSKRRTLKEKLRDGVGRFIGDYCFTCSLIEFADIIADYVPVYMYYFTMRSTANPWPKWMGVMHGYEIEYFFGQPIARPSLYDEKYLETEQRFSKYVLQLWSDFCTTGSPASYWPRYNKRDRKALVLSEQSSSENNNIIEDVHGQQCKLINKWKKIANKRRSWKYSFLTKSEYG